MYRYGPGSKKQVKKVKFIAALFVTLLTSSFCLANSIRYSETLVTSSNSNDGGFPGLTFTANLTTDGSGNFTLDFQVTDTSSTAATLNGFTLSLLGGGNGSITVNPADSVLPNSTWSELDNATINNGNSGTSCSTGMGDGGWLCASGSTPLTLSSTGGPFDFLFSGTYAGSVSTPFDLKANGTVGGNKVAVSDYMMVNAPEPSSMLLLGGGLSGLALLRKRKKFKEQ